MGDDGPEQLVHGAAVDSLPAAGSGAPEDRGELYPVNLFKGQLNGGKWMTAWFNFILNIS